MAEIDRLCIVVHRQYADGYVLNPIVDELDRAIEDYWRWAAGRDYVRCQECKKAGRP